MERQTPGSKICHMQSVERPYAGIRVAEKEADAELVRLAQGGDERAFQALVVKYQRRIARHVARFLRAGGEAPEELSVALRDLTAATWALAAALEEPSRADGEVRRLASRAAAHATRSFEGSRDLGLAEIVAQVRSMAIDLMRAADAATARSEPADDPVSEELLVELFDDERSPTI